MTKPWKKGRGKLGFLEPLMGHWLAQAETPMGPVRCTRNFVKMGAYVRLESRWEFGGRPDGKVYQEIALIGVGDDGKVAFWSFTSDGKRSQGTVADVRDLHQNAIGFEARMPAGLARMAYWPDEDGGGFYWVVESKNKKGWNRFVKHHYRPLAV
jgi:hypothetical protein